MAFAFAYEGWITATSINAELKNARRNLPLALIVGALFCTALYCLYIFSMSAVGDVDTIIGTWPLGERLPGIAFSKVFGNAAGTLVYVFVAVSCLGTMNGLIMGSWPGHVFRGRPGDGAPAGVLRRSGPAEQFLRQVLPGGADDLRFLVCLDGDHVDEGAGFHGRDPQ